MIPTQDKTYRARRPSRAMPERDPEVAQDVLEEKQKRIGLYSRRAALGLPIFEPARNGVVPEWV